MTVSTPNYHWSMPDPGGSANTWGSLCNGVFTAIDTSLWDISANTATFAGAVTVNGALITAGGASFGGQITCNGFTNLNGYTVSQAIGVGNAYFVLNNNAGTGMGYLYWNPSNQVVLVNPTGGGNFILNSDGTASVSGLLTTQGLSTTSISCSNIFATGSISASGNSSANGNITSGSFMAAGTGYCSKAGTTNAPDTSHFYNHYWTGSQNHLYLDNSDWGVIQTVPSDYRMKKDVAPLPSMWDQVRALKPIRYTLRDWTPPSDVETQQKNAGGAPLVAGDDIERWGFLAHELQETLVESAANGIKDDPVQVQTPNPFTVIAALTRALQEAMMRIEALEAAR